MPIEADISISQKRTASMPNAIGRDDARYRQLDPRIAVHIGMPDTDTRAGSLHSKAR
jgi:hypothetical protein